MHCVIIQDAQACPYRDSNAREVTGVIQADTKAIGNGEIDSQEKLMFCILAQWMLPGEL